MERKQSRIYIVIYTLLCLFSVCVYSHCADVSQESHINRRALVLLLSSPSGGGKTVIANKLLKNDRNLTLAISVTTRPPRPGEVHGRDYYFMNEHKFQSLTKQKAFLQMASVFGHHYGTLRKDVEQSLHAGKDVLFTVDWQGARSLSQAYPKDIVRIYILPPNLHVLENRLIKRSQDAPEVIQNRMALAMREISHWSEYDYVIVNNDLDTSVAQVQAILQSERLKRSRQVGLQTFVNRLSSQIKD